MRPISFSEPGEYEFRFRGMPNEEMSLELYVGGGTIDDFRQLTHPQTALEAILVDQKGRIVCHGIGLPLHGDLNGRPNGWVLEAGPHDAAYYHMNCLRIQMNSHDSYILTLRIREVDPQTPRTNLILMLSGGQTGPALSRSEERVSLSPNGSWQVSSGCH